MEVQVLSSTVPAHRMCQTLLIVFTFADAALHTDKGSSALKYRACAPICQTSLIFFTFRDAALHPDIGTSALKYRACTQKVLVVCSFLILGCWPTPR
jgi:hypothetical protein